MASGRDSDSSVSPIIKYLVFIFNFLFWLIGLALIGIGAWAFLEKNKLEYNTDSGSGLDLYDITFDLSIIMMIIGGVIFVISFLGCIGALRENLCLLKTFAYVLGFIFLGEVVLACLAFVFSSEVKAKVTDLLAMEGLERYREDDDFRNLIDWTQKTFECCGVSLKGYQDWSRNVYFNCTDDNRSVERCGVPYSCCRQPDDIEATIINTACGHKTQELSIYEAKGIIFTDGCVGSIIGFAENNLYVVGGVAIGLAVPQLLGIFLSRLLSNQIEDTRANWV
ncbi:hypothetical protein CAPTEDRAFT_132011 [Capitella teleta]|uniref:Tetraspanin n=1 Tax=Capitella teleta TaxID=283909 RepID=R7T870_CAPTE|nr:hypothetical protein CAPTEDRAFT_132011 [Capitella teleta]|eukprot:ELT87615.1 hypothetical protein CAPTEDRAFT_132011 [Capitella teleta]